MSHPWNNNKEKITPAMCDVQDWFVMVSVGDKFNPYTGTGISASISANRTSRIACTQFPNQNPHFFERVGLCKEQRLHKVHLRCQGTKLDM